MAICQDVDPIPPSESIFDLVIKAESGELLALFKENGDLLLKGSLTENGNP